MPEFRIIDAHVHVAGPGSHKQGLYWHKRFSRSANFKKLKFIKGISLKRITDELMVNSLLVQTRTAKRVDKVVVLALDHVYGEDGVMMGPARDSAGDIDTTFYVSNGFVKDLCRQPGNSNLLFGLSVHPFRQDAVAELEKYHRDAVLCKWLPSSQMIDFDSHHPQVRDKLERFYQKLAQINLPLLFHAGREDSIPSAGGDDYQRFNNPRYIIRALDIGVAVIVAHCGCSYFDEIPRTDAIEDLLELFRRKKTDKPEWKLYADISAVYSPYRKKSILDRVFRNIDAEDLIYGSDWPNPSKGPRWWANPLWILRYSGENLIDRYKKISDQWLPEYFSPADIETIYTNFHRLLEQSGRAHLIP